MGCVKSSLKDDAFNGGPTEGMVRKHPHVTRILENEQEYYALAQSFAIVRHGDRLDHTPAWETFPGAKKWPNDSPLTEDGHKHATEVGRVLRDSGKPYKMIISSPYFRCAQTASRIAQVLNLPVHFDVDLGEVFDDVSMRGGNLQGKPQYRCPMELEAQLKPDFPDVTWIRDSDDIIKVEGKLQNFPEPFDGARMRFCYKTKKLVQKAAAELMSIVIVTHGDGVAAVVGLLREEWQITSVPYTAYALCSRRVKVLKLGSEKVIDNEPVYQTPKDWTLKLSPGFGFHHLRDRCSKRDAHMKHLYEMNQMNALAPELDKTTEYTLADEQVKHFQEALDRLGAHDDDKDHLLDRAATNHHMAGDRSKRIVCHPEHSKENNVPSKEENKV
jgi:broad specificity phosphatase PhoE